MKFTVENGVLCLDPMPDVPRETRLAIRPYAEFEPVTIPLTFEQMDKVRATHKRLVELAEHVHEIFSRLQDSSLISEYLVVESEAWGPVLVLRPSRWQCEPGLTVDPYHVAKFLCIVLPKAFPEGCDITTQEYAVHVRGPWQTVALNRLEQALDDAADWLRDITLVPLEADDAQ